MKNDTQTGEIFIKDGHLKYELGMLMFAFHQISQLVVYSQFWGYVRLDVFLLHARNLFDFIRQNKEGKSFQAEKYQSEIDSLNCQDFVKKYYNDICIQLSHPSDQRKQNYDWQNDFPEIYNGILDNYEKLFSIHNIDIKSLENAIKKISFKMDMDVDVSILTLPGSCNTFK
jgi:hypothetical protein